MKIRPFFVSTVQQLSVRYNFGNVDNHFHSLFHRFQWHIFVLAVEVVAAGKNVGAGQAFEREIGSVGAAADGHHLGFYAGFLDGLFGNLHHVEYGLNLFAHVVVLVLDVAGDTLTVLLVEEIGDS